jgi:hypothetical protein
VNLVLFCVFEPFPTVIICIRKLFIAALSGAFLDRHSLKAAAVAARFFPSDLNPRGFASIRG